MVLQRDGDEADVPLTLQQRTETAGAFTVVEGPEVMAVVLVMVSAAVLAAAGLREEGYADLVLPPKGFLLIQGTGHYKMKKRPWKRK